MIDFRARIRAAALGTTKPRRITYDADPGVAPRDGDVLRTVRGHLWLIVHARGVRSRVALNRWALDVVKIEEPLPPARGRRVLSFRWYPRGKRRR